MDKRLRCALLLSLFLAVSAFGRNDAASPEFRDPTPAEKAMSSVAFAAGASAVVLNWHQFVNDRSAYRSEYVRIKILSEEGKKYGNIEIPHIALLNDVDHIKARTVRPDGSVAPFDGKTFDKVILKVNGIRLLAKTFTLPDVQVGSIIEYRYDLTNRAHMLYNTEFAIQRELPVVHEEISLQPYIFGGFNTFFSFRGLPPGKRPELHKETYELELENIPPFEEEPFAPPAATIKPELQFWYTNGTIEPEVFWTKQAQAWADTIEPFVGDGHAVREAAMAEIGNVTMPEEKLRKLYARAQKIRNLSFEPEKTDAETRNLKDNGSAQDVLRNGYGDLRDVNRLFVSMARAAGFDAHVVRICERDEQYLAKNVPIGGQLDGEIAEVTVDGKALYCDPGTPYAAFDVPAWQKTHTSGLLIARKQEKAVWIETPRLSVDAAVTTRVADLKLEDGVVRGTVAITYMAQEALRERFALRNDDDAAARKSLEESLKSLFADGSVVKLTDVKSLRTTDGPLVVSAEVELPSTASMVGSRAMVPPAMFAATLKNPFTSEQRKTAIYFHYPYRTVDDVTLHVPAGYAIESLPAPADINMGALRYVTTFDTRDNSVHFVRKVTVDAEVVGRDQYRSVREFFSRVAANDQTQMVLRKAAAADGKGH
jgi:hypothetical protein